VGECKLTATIVLTPLNIISIPPPLPLDSPELGGHTLPSILAQSFLPNPTPAWLGNTILSSGPLFSRESAGSTSPHWVMNGIFTPLMQMIFPSYYLHFIIQNLLMMAIDIACVRPSFHPGGTT